jgi:hypothetical protein
MFRVLKEDKLLETAERLEKRIAERFPQSGLSQVAGEVVQITREALVRAERIRRPNVPLRVGLVLVVVLAVVGGVVELQTLDEPMSAVHKVWQLLDATKGAAVYLAAIALFVITLEVRLKRRRALQAIHELRALAHIIDMHQLTKDPDRLGDPEAPLMSSGRVMTAEAMGRYLHYCTELLALVSKIGQLYVQDFPDGIALAAVDQFENLATGLSQKIWQKIMILDRIRTNAAEGYPPSMNAAESVAPAKG